MNALAADADQLFYHLYDYDDPDEERLPPDTDRIPLDWDAEPHG